MRAFGCEVAFDQAIVLLERLLVVVPMDWHGDGIGDERTIESTNGYSVRTSVVHTRVLAKKSLTRASGQRFNISSAVP